MWNGSLRIGWMRALQVAALPGGMAGACYLLVFGFDDALRIARTVAPQSSFGNEYMQAFAQGPWYRYLVDFLVLSPWSFLLAVCGAAFVAIGRGDRRLSVWLALCVYLLSVYAWMYKDARYLLLLIVPVSMLAAAALAQISRTVLAFGETRIEPGVRRRRAEIGMRAAILGIVVLLVASHLAAFRHFFVVAGIYDPMTYNLLRADRMLPDAQPRAAVPAANASVSLDAARHRWLEQPTAESARTLSYEYCAAGAYLECRWASQEAITLAPGDAGAYNNLCIALGGLRQWTQAAAACREALRLKSDFQLARNNLAWVEAEAAKL
jgi:hypothetical protein